jgi:hypothetical protein
VADLTGELTGPAIGKTDARRELIVARAQLIRDARVTVRAELISARHEACLEARTRAEREH